MRNTIPPVLDKLQLDLPLYSINESGKGMIRLPKVKDLLEANPERPLGWELRDVGAKKAIWHVSLGHQAPKHLQEERGQALTDAESEELELRRSPTISDRDLVTMATGIAKQRYDQGVALSEACKVSFLLQEYEDQMAYRAGGNVPNLVRLKLLRLMCTVIVSIKYPPLDGYKGKHEQALITSGSVTEVDERPGTYVIKIVLNEYTRYLIEKDRFITFDPAMNALRGFKKMLYQHVHGRNPTPTYKISVGRLHQTLFYDHSQRLLRQTRRMIKGIAKKGNIGPYLVSLKDGDVVQFVKPVSRKLERAAHQNKLEQLREEIKLEIAAIKIIDDKKSGSTT